MKLKLLLFQKMNSKDQPVLSKWLHLTIFCLLFSMLQASADDSYPSKTEPKSEQITGNVYYMSPTGNNSNDGSINSPFANLNKFVSICQPGDVLYMREAVLIMITKPTLQNQVLPGITLL